MHRADEGVRADPPAPALRQLQCPSHRLARATWSCSIGHGSPIVVARGPGRGQAGVALGNDDQSVNEDCSLGRYRPRAMSAASRAEARRYGRTAGLLSVGIGAGGVLTYLYFALASHTLSRVELRQIVVLWSAVVVTVSVLYRPVEQLLSRTLAERRHAARRRACRCASPRRSRWESPPPSRLIALALHDAARERSASRATTALYVVLVVAVTRLRGELLRARLSRRHRPIHLLAALLLSEASAGSRSRWRWRSGWPRADGGGAGIAFAPLFSLVVVPLALVGAPAPRSTDAPRAGAVGDDRGPSSRSATAAASPRRCSLIMLSEQTLPERRPAARSRAGRSRRGRLHLQRPAGRPGAAAALPGDRHEPPPPPHSPALPGRRRRVRLSIRRPCGRSPPSRRRRAW